MAQFLKNHWKMKNKEQQHQSPLFGKDEYKVAKWSTARSCLCVCVCVCVCVSCLVMPDSLQPHRLQPTRPPPSMGLSRQEHWSGLPFPSPKGTIERKKVKSFSRVWLSATPWTVAHQVPPSVEFSRQEYQSWVPFPSPEGGVIILHYMYLITDHRQIWKKCS